MIRGIGLDIVDIARIAELYQRHGERFLKRVFTEREIAYCMTKSDPAPSLSARFAAKEAASKALGTGIAEGVLFKDIEVLKEGTRPVIALHNQARERAEGMGVSFIHLSISHERSYAAAVVVMEG